MQMSDLRARLKQLEEVLQGWGCKATDVSQLAEFGEALEPFSSLSVKQFIQMLREKGDVEKKPRTFAVLNEALVARYTAVLLEADLPRTEAIQAVAQLRADKAAKVPELTQIAAAIGVTKPSKKRADIIQGIETALNRRFNIARDLDGTSGSF